MKDTACSAILQSNNIYSEKISGTGKLFIAGTFIYYQVVFAQLVVGLLFNQAFGQRELRFEQSDNLIV
jgi:hypothetical protein